MALALQISFGALQAMDPYSTVRSLRMGSAEANPLVRGIARDPLVLAAVKAAAATSSLLLIRRVARKHRATAVVTLVAMNAAYAVIVAHNLRTARVTFAGANAKFASALPGRPAGGP